jgi:enoyl-CoA hydratase/carnithine racemase
MIALASDYRVMRSDRGFLCLPEIDLGMTLIPSMNALVTANLSGTVLRDMLLAGKRIGGDEAAARGLVDASCGLDQLLGRAQEAAQAMIGKDRKTLAGLKADIHRPVLEVIRAA